MKVKDITFAETFWDDYEAASVEARRTLDRKVKVILDQQRLIPSLKTHSAVKVDILIGWVTVGNPAWRIWFTVSKDHTMEIKRFMKHRLQDRLLGRR